MKKCNECVLREIQNKTLELVLASWQGKIAECRRLGHIPYTKLKDRDLCFNCLALGHATVEILADRMQHPQDLSGRPLRTSRSDPSRDGGVWVAAPPESRTKTVLLIFILAALALGSALLLTWRLG